jgi:hypothetical protein
LILATESDRLEFFDRLELSRDYLPQKRFVSRSGKRTTTRYFVDRQPIVVRPHGRTPGGVATFAFVDEGLVTLSRFERFLNEHGQLLGALREFALIYVADSPRHFVRAATLAESVVHAGLTQTLALADASEAKLLGYFALRKRFEERELASFNREQLLELRDGRLAFSGTEIEQQYERWRTQGTPRVAALPVQDTTPTTRFLKTFATELLPHDYALFGQVLPE